MMSPASSSSSSVLHFASSNNSTLSPPPPLPIQTDATAAPSRQQRRTARNNGSAGGGRNVGNVFNPDGTSPKSTTSHRSLAGDIMGTLAMELPPDDDEASMAAMIGIGTAVAGTAQQPMTPTVRGSDGGGPPLAFASPSSCGHQTPGAASSSPAFSTCGSVVPNPNANSSDCGGAAVVGLDKFAFASALLRSTATPGQSVTASPQQPKADQPPAEATPNNANLRHTSAPPQIAIASDAFTPLGPTAGTISPPTAVPPPPADPMLAFFPGFGG